MNNVIIDAHARLLGSKPGRSYRFDLYNKSIELSEDVKLVIHGSATLTAGVDTNVLVDGQYGTRTLLFGAFIADGDVYLGFSPGYESAHSSVVKLKSRYLFILPSGFITEYSATLAGRYAADQIQITNIAGSCSIAGSDLNLEYILAFSEVE